MSNVVGYLLVWIGAFTVAKADAINFWVFVGFSLAIAGHAISSLGAVTQDELFSKIGDLRKKQREDIVDILDSHEYRKEISLNYPGSSLSVLQKIINDIRALEK